MHPHVLSPVALRVSLGGAFVAFSAWAATRARAKTRPVEDIEPVALSIRELLGIVREDLRRHHGAWGLPGFQALVVHRFGVYRLHQPRPIRVVLSVIYRVLNFLVHNLYGINLYDSTQVGRKVMFGNQGNVSIHRDAIIEEGTCIRHNVTLGQAYPDRNTGGPHLGRNIEVGPGAVIIGPIKIGDDSRIGANVVVTTNIPPNSIVLYPAPRVISRGSFAQDAAPESPN